MNDAFPDRTVAGRELAKRLLALDLPDPVVLALPRGGVPVAAEVAAALHAPLDLLLVRKIGAPAQPELAIAAIAEGAGPLIDRDTMFVTGATHDYVEREADAELREIARRRSVYLRGRAPLPVQGKSAVVVDDGIATGTTMRAALQALRRRRPARVVLAVPVASSGAVAALRAEVDDVVCLSQPSHFRAVGLHYVDFHQVSDDEVVAILEQVRAHDAADSTPRPTLT
jgi:putative phosphoribosyl transferase